MEGKTFLLSHSSFLPDHGTIRWRDKPLTAHDVTHVVWYSPWRSFEHTDPAKYRTDNRYHIIGHVPVMMIDDRYWQGNRMPEMPVFYHDPVNRIINIDLGCAMIPIIKANPDRFEESFKRVPSICVLNLENFVKGVEPVATYIK